MRDAVGTTFSDNTTNVTAAAPVHPQTTRQKNVTRTITNQTDALRYKWLSVSGTSRCRLQSGTGDDDTEWTQTQTATGPATIAWTARNAGTGYAYRPRTINVAGLKAGGSNWNQTLTVPNLTITSANWVAVKASGMDIKPKNDPDDNDVQDYTYFSATGSSSPLAVTWRGCVEERRMDNTITSSSALSPLTANSIDLNVKQLAETSNDDTRWRPWLSGAFFRPDMTGQSDECPSPALKLQEIASYSATTLTTNYPMLFDPTSGGASSYYYPYSSTAANNVASIKNYIRPNPAGRWHASRFRLHLGFAPAFGPRHVRQRKSGLF